MPEGATWEIDKPSLWPSLSARMADDITCSITPWYTKRMSLMTTMFVGFGLYFFYDGAIGYPKKNKIYNAHEAFVAIQDEKQAFLDEGGTNIEWAKVVEEKDYPLQTEWIDYAAVNGWPEEPPEKLYSTNDQFFFGTLCLVIGLAVLGTMITNRKRQLRADEASFYTPKGLRVPFASAFRVDKRKWDNKGLAYVHYRDDNEKECRATIDDLKFGGADQILTRLLDNFDGELVNRVSNEPAPPPEEAETPEKSDSEDK